MAVAQGGMIERRITVAGKVLRLASAKQIGTGIPNESGAGGLNSVIDFVE